MIRDLFSVGSENNTNRDGIKIIITIDNGTFIMDNSPTGVFYGIPPFTGSHPVTYYTIAANQLNFQGNINSLYSELYVQSNDKMLTGRITVEPALPVIVYIGTYGGQGSFDLPAGTTSAPFKIPIANYGTEGESQRTSRLAKILDGTE